MVIVKNEQESFVPVERSESLTSNSEIQLPKFKLFQRRLQLSIYIPKDIDNKVSLPTTSQWIQKLFYKRSRRELDDFSKKQIMSREHESAGSNENLQITSYSISLDDPRRPCIKRTQDEEERFFPDDDENGRNIEDEIRNRHRIDGRGCNSVEENDNKVSLTLTRRQWIHNLFCKRSQRELDDSSKQMSREHEPTGSTETLQITTSKSIVSNDRPYIRRAQDGNKRFFSDVEENCRNIKDEIRNLHRIDGRDCNSVKGNESDNSPIISRHEKNSDILLSPSEVPRYIFIPEILFET